MRDTIKLYNDNKRFMTRFRRAYKNYHIEYIMACEPQASGSWHSHLIIIFDTIPPFIPNKTIENLWGQGFTKTQKLNDIDNVGAYLTAYLGDMEYSEENICTLLNNGLNGSKIVLKEVNEIEGIKLNEPKNSLRAEDYIFTLQTSIYIVALVVLKTSERVLAIFSNKRKSRSITTDLFKRYQII